MWDPCKGIFMWGWGMCQCVCAGVGISWTWDAVGVILGMGCVR